MKFLHILFTAHLSKFDLFLCRRFEPKCPFRIDFSLPGIESKTPGVRFSFSFIFAENTLDYGMCDKMVVETTDSMYSIGDYNIRFHPVDLTLYRLFNLVGIHLLQFAIGQIQYGHAFSTQPLLYTLHLFKTDFTHLFFGYAQPKSLFGSLPFGECQQIDIVACTFLHMHRRGRAEGFIVRMWKDVEYLHVFLGLMFWIIRLFVLPLPGL